MADDPGMGVRGFLAAVAGVGTAAAPEGRWNNGCFIKLVRAGPPNAPGPAERREAVSVGRDPEGDPESGRVRPTGVVGEGEDDVAEGRLGCEVDSGDGDTPE